MCQIFCIMAERNGQTGRRAAALLGGRRDGLASHKFGSIKIAVSYPISYSHSVKHIFVSYF